MINALTFDIEDIYHRNDITIKEIRNYNNKVFEESIDTILKILQRHNITATFFILGEVAVKQKNIIRKIVDSGNEIASHSFYHNLVYNLTKKEFKNDVEKSVKTLEDITGEKILGYRAPSWSITDKSLWALEILREIGIKYDSSIFPVKTSIYGIKKSGNFMYEVIPGLIEIPPTTLKLWRIKIPVSSGVFFRLMPYPFIKHSIKQSNRLKEIAIISLHNWEFYTSLPSIEVPLKDYLRYNVNLSFLKYTSIKLDKLLKIFKFASIKCILKIK